MSSRSRRQAARDVRLDAAEMAAARHHPTHLHNGDEGRFRRHEVVEGKAAQELSYIGNFTKGLPHHPKTGLLLNPPDYRQFVLGIQSGSAVDFQATPLGPATPPGTPGCLSTSKVTCDAPATGSTWQSQQAQAHCADVRAWESQSAGLLFDLEGPDAQAVTMPPAPSLTSAEAIAEMAEVYAMALLRDVHFSQLRDPELGKAVDAKQECDCPPVTDVEEVARLLEKLEWFQLNCCDLDDDERARHRDGSFLTRQTLFRGVAPGDDAGPYLSQFLLLGNVGLEGANQITDGRVSYGAIDIDQRVRFADPCKDYMTTFESWLDVQNGADLRGTETYQTNPKYRFMTTPRDLATYVHYDALYEAYLNACLVMLGMGVPFDKGIPFQAPDVHDKQQAFASFGGPHILTLVTEVATRALKAVRFQKFNVHRRLRPEAMAGLVDRFKNARCGELEPMSDVVHALHGCGLLELVEKHNHCQNQRSDRKADAGAGQPSFLLPMAFPEGSPMHPSYGAGHATVAGACVTILKAFFDHGHELVDAKGAPIAFEADANGQSLVPLSLKEALTVEGELNKIAANISIGRDWAGVHYFTDYIESLRMGEQIAVELLEEQRLTYGENFTMTVPLFDGSAVRI